MSNRRSFLRLLGAGAASAPAMAKAAVPDLARFVGAESTLVLGSSAALAPGTEGVRDAVNAIDSGKFVADAIDQMVDKVDVVQAIATYLVPGQLPEFAEEELRESTRYVSALDPDLAAHKSWSMSVKMATQRDRQFHRALAAQIRLAKNRESLAERLSCSLVSIGLGDGDA